MMGCEMWQAMVPGLVAWGRAYQGLFISLSGQQARHSLTRMPSLCNKVSRHTHGLEVVSKASHEELFAFRIHNDSCSSVFAVRCWPGADVERVDGVSTNPQIQSSL